MPDGLTVTGARYDVFLSHHSADRALVEELARSLAEVSVSCFLDSRSIPAGAEWVRSLEAALEATRSFVICFGSSGVGPWMEKEIHSALARATHDSSFRVIPVLLPGSSREQLNSASLFLRQHQACDLRRGFHGQAFEQLLQALGRGRSESRPPSAGTQEQLATEILEDLERLQLRFCESIRPLLAGRELISRSETQEVLSLLDADAARLVVIHGAAGSGKSGVLLELAEALAEQGDAFLPARLDRVELRGDPKRFGEALGLPGSPGRCLATLGRERRVVLLLDQLDALRWTGAHSSEAWDVCRETILDTLAASLTTRVVVCCRTFDLQHDPQLRSWKEQAKSLREVQVGDLSDEQVQAALGRAASSRGQGRPIGDRERKLLRHVHHLQMWLTLHPRLGSEGSLSTRRALMEAFWQDRRRELTRCGIGPDRVEAVEERLVGEMQEGARLTTSLGALRLSSGECQAFQSLEILQVDAASNLVSFCHQSYLDYLVALRIVGGLGQGKGKTLLAWLGTREEQSLFRREQLRLVLEELRGRDAEAYLEQLSALLAGGDAVRFHLRLLCLQFLSQLGEPSRAERDLVLGLLGEPYWREHVLSDVIRGQKAWFEVLDDAGVLEQWLASDDEGRRRAALEMLMYVVETSGDRVAHLLRPYLGRDEHWIHRILWVLRFAPDKDSEALFDLRLELTKRGSYTAEHVQWSELAEKHPMRFVALACHLLLSLAESLLAGQERRRVGRRAELDWYGLERVTPALIPAVVQDASWEMLFKAVTSVARVRRYRGENDRVLESYSVEIETLEPVMGLLRDLGRSLLEADWLAFVTRAENLASACRQSEVLFLDTLRGGPAEPNLADWALGWLMADAWRARLRMKRDAGEWQLSGPLIERYASVCSEATFRRLEEWLLAYREPDLRERYAERSFGRTQHALLPRLPPDRASQAVPRRIAELNRKFGATDVAGRFEGGQVRTGWVTSPLGHQVLEGMSDRALLKLVASPKLRDGRGRGRWGWKKDHFEEASPRTIASDFRMAAQRAPERFGRLMTSWPADGQPIFWCAILSGLRSPEDHGQVPGAEGWKAPSHELLEAVISLSMVQAAVRGGTDTQVASDLCDVIGRYAEYQWSDAAVDLLVWIAQHHHDPAPGYFPVVSGDRSAAEVDDVEINALNVTRGRAAYTIRALLFRHPELLPRLRPAIESLIRDPHPAVRVAAFAACLPVVNIDKDEAVEYFVEACDGQDQLLATREARVFFHYSYRSHLRLLLPIVDRMVASPVSRVATAGATCVAASFLVEGDIEERFEQCIFGTWEQRKGVAEVAASLIGEGEYAERAKAALLRLAEDSDDRVAGEVARSFRQLDLRHITSDRETWTRFARSKAFQADPTYLLIALEQQSGDLVPFSECLLSSGTTFAEELAEAARDQSRHLAGDASHYLLPLLLRLYEQAKDRDPGVYLRCLDLWDRLLERRVGSAMGLARELDRL